GALPAAAPRAVLLGADPEVGGDLQDAVGGLVAGGGDRRAADLPVGGHVDGEGRAGDVERAAVAGDQAQRAEHLPWIHGPAVVLAESEGAVQSRGAVGLDGADNRRRGRGDRRGGGLRG